MIQRLQLMLKIYGLLKAYSESGNTGERRTGPILTGRLILAAKPQTHLGTWTLCSLFTCGMMTLVQLQAAPGARAIPKPLRPLSTGWPRVPQSHAGLAGVQGPLFAVHPGGTSVPSPEAGTPFARAACFQPRLLTTQRGGPSGHQDPAPRVARPFCHLCR